MKTKTPNLLKEAHAEYDRSIREDERNKVLKEYGSTLTQLYKLGSQIMQMTAGFQPPREDGIETHDATIKTMQPKRKLVTATAEHIGAALQVLCSTAPRYAPLSAKNVAAEWGAEGGKRLAGAALKALVADGRAIVKRGKYAQKEPTVEVGSDGNVGTADTIAR